MTVVVAYSTIIACAFAALLSRLYACRSRLLFPDSRTLCSSISPELQPAAEVQCSAYTHGKMMNIISSNRGSGDEASYPDVQARSQAPLNMNHYANKKTAAESMLDVALLMANASQLKAVLDQGPDFSFYTAIVTLISISLCLQVTVGVLLIFIVRWNLDDERTHWRLNIMENVATGLVFMIVVVNIFITAFGVHRPNRSD